MLIEKPSGQRTVKTETLDCDLAVVGGGMAGVCCAITAAREGLDVVLVQDRPVLGGNASSEVRLWILGATAHMSNNNRWAREGGVMDEILTENMYRNPEGNPVIVDTIMLEKVIEEKNIRLLLNTTAMEVSRTDDDLIESVTAYCGQNETRYDIKSRFFCDASGDGIVGFLSGAAFRIGAESAEEFDEKFAPDEAYGKMLGHSIYFYTQDEGKQVNFVAPSYAMKDVHEKIPRIGHYQTAKHGCHLWWIEYGGRLDTIHDTEKIKWELWKVVYGLWDHVKNSGEYPEAKNLTLQWVGLIPGKRESRRFEGEYMINQRDIIEQREFADAVAHGGWSIDLHPADGVFSPRPGCNQYHAKGVYGIPYRCMYSRNIGNLFLAGRVISASHVAFGSTRVMATCAAAAQAVGVAASLCKEKQLLPADVSEAVNMKQLQTRLARVGQFIPQTEVVDDGDLAGQASISASSELKLQKLEDSGDVRKLENDLAQLLPVAAGAVPKMKVLVDVAKATALRMELRVSSKPYNHTPDVTLAEKVLKLSKGDGQVIEFDFDVELTGDQYVFYCLMNNEDVSVHLSDWRVSGLVTAEHWYTQKTDKDIGVEEFEFWRPMRRPDGKNLAFELDTAIENFGAENMQRYPERPTNLANVFIPDLADDQPTVELKWDAVQRISRVVVTFDNDLDHPMESVLWGQPEHVMPACVLAYELTDGDGQVVYRCEENHQGRNEIAFDGPLETDGLTLKLVKKGDMAGAGVFGLRCYS